MQAACADDFVGSIGCNIHGAYPSYSANWAALKTALVNSGIRHVRDVTLAQDTDQRAAIADLYSHGITATMILFPPGGVIPAAGWWSAYGAGETRTINDYLAWMPAGAIDAIEGPNELDIFYGLYKYHAGLNDDLSSNPASPLYYGAYGVAITQALWTAMRADAALNAIKIVGPAVGVQVPSPFADGSLYGYVDNGAFHPYPARANGFNDQAPYGTIPKYYLNSFQPSGNIAADPYNPTPLMFDWYQQAFKAGAAARAMWATETGYTNGGTTSFFSVASAAKHTPRLFAEYFRNGIARTFWYELFDEGTDATDAEQNDGLIYNNLTPKPALTALTSLISLLADPGASFAPSSLSYSLSVAPNGAYTRTEYVHDLLLQKRGGEYYLLLWHEISNSSNTDTDGNPITGVQRDISQPSLTTTITLPSSISRATLYTYAGDWSLSSSPLTISGNQITVQAADKISVIKLASGGDMAFNLVNVSADTYICLSGDSKPTDGVRLGALAYESDTGRWFIFDGSTWPAYRGSRGGF